MLNKYYTNKSKTGAAAEEYCIVKCHIKLIYIKQNNSVSGIHIGLLRCYAVDLKCLLLTI